MSTTPVPAESTAGIELASATERATAAKVEALGPQVEGKARHVCGYCHENESAGLMHCEGKGEVDMLRRWDSGEGNIAA
jgi:hypothetical protein